LEREVGEYSSVLSNTFCQRCHSSRSRIQERGIVTSTVGAPPEAQQMALAGDCEPFRVRDFVPEVLRASYAAPDVGSEVRALSEQECAGDESLRGEIESLLEKPAPLRSRTLNRRVEEAADALPPAS
jgi:hypothetical protein